MPKPRWDIRAYAALLLCGVQFLDFHDKIRVLRALSEKFPSAQRSTLNSAIAWVLTQNRKQNTQ